MTTSHRHAEGHLLFDVPETFAALGTEATEGSLAMSLEDVGVNDRELWLFRVPPGLSCESLHNVQLKLDLSDDDDDNAGMFSEQLSKKKARKYVCLVTLARGVVVPGWDSPT